MPRARNLDSPESLPPALSSALTTHFPATAPGAAVGVLYGGRCLAGAAGLSSLSPALPFTAQTQFRACSITKQLVALLLLQLAAESVLSLDDPPGRYVPALAGLDPGLRL